MLWGLGHAWGAAGRVAAAPGCSGMLRGMLAAECRKLRVRVRVERYRLW